ncbi:enoyl-CoA hydratase/isomerase family protein [Nocardioides jishulii]|uniref:Enoyl-CoA hydratase/isomerase family protein n=1 Tax=Nocardioides jishulii TaxID=2575440 RepID=A0A4U2YNT9_9ACTN|nr:enoyl-CoA hydratase/isomerase family protein [Nocardioides jishulii]QCX27505.1 enoyl-CoA hydratase/isomerase family protein [Nocardioides jishulii]TKI62312.1 enoyl-CoA hydratase/isomerase family protein [Nocardioides jishulii]
MTPEELAAVGLRLDVDGAVATITLDRPDVRNAQTPGMWRALARVGQSLPADVRVVVVEGEGEHFSSGLDRSVLDPRGAAAGGESVLALLAGSDETMADTIGEYQEGFTFLRDPRFVSIAKVRGYAVGAGFQLALSCDFRLVADDAKFSMKESALGLVPDLTGTKPLVEAVGYSRALEICATARVVAADEAVRIGLALSAHPADELDGAVETLATTLVGTMPDVVAETKALLQGAEHRTLDEQRQLERTSQTRRFRAVAAAMGG